MNLKLFVAVAVLGLVGAEAKAGPFRHATCSNGSCGATAASTCSNGSCGAASVGSYTVVKPCSTGQCAPQTVAQNVSNPVQISSYTGQLESGMWVTLDNGKVVRITSVGSQATTGTIVVSPVRKLPEPDSRPKAPKRD